MMVCCFLRVCVCVWVCALMVLGFAWMGKWDGVCMVCLVWVCS